VQLRFEGCLHLALFANSLRCNGASAAEGRPSVARLASSQQPVTRCGSRGQRDSAKGKGCGISGVLGLAQGFIVVLLLMIILSEIGPDLPDREGLGFNLRAERRV
jgi:hypothetical protein